jgi:hypothetical protein
MSAHTETTPHVRDISALFEAVPVAGPPAILLAAPLILLALVLAGPVALLITFALVLAAAAGLVAALAAIVASPFLLVRHLRAVRARDAAAKTTDNAPTVTPVVAPGF